MIKLPEVSTKYGAPMGRPNAAPANWQADPEPRSLRLAKIPLDSGGYDSGGAYWGHSPSHGAGRGQQLYCLATRDGEPLAFVRASRRLTAAMALGVPQYALAQRLPAEEILSAFIQWTEGRYPPSWDEYDLASWFRVNS